MKDMTATLQMSVVPPAVLDVVWPQTAPLLQKAIDTTRPRYDIDSVRAGLETSDLLLWCVFDGTTPIAVMTTRIVEYPNSKALCLDWIGGERMKDWLPMAHDVMRRYGHDNGCTHLEGYGRKAWGRALQKYGWEPEYIAFRMELGE